MVQDLHSGVLCARGFCCQRKSDWPSLILSLKGPSSERLPKVTLEIFWDQGGRASGPLPLLSTFGVNLELTLYFLLFQIKDTLKETMNTTVQEDYGTPGKDPTTQAWDFMQVEVSLGGGGPVSLGLHAGGGEWGGEVLSAWDFIQVEVSGGMSCKPGTSCRWR